MRLVGVLTFLQYKGRSIVYTIPYKIGELNYIIQYILKKVKTVDFSII